uniref:2-succinyl-5-enolpyruvyl-6-hydroxy-3- cyclohexene-1-carboxylic-acid synthase n=1 Tax=uncultured Micrococcus sp. TaxID=114051 RepID=UPI0026197101|nr:2-succinyl-5-enolpyruvyl-6-hydroxy-3-cyclohexene-1-carboxylic-acid synthase [uncultured Micrococcus sp.]
MTSADSLSVARAVAAALTDAGMRDAVICPGSRSAPLVYALADLERQGRIRLHVRVDERAAGFLAHGLSLASGRPVGVLTTSGTAVGNLLPALMESFHAGTRLVALTADRPAELHGSGANQTTEQDGIFGHHTRFSATIEADPAAGRSAQQHLNEAGATVRQALLAADGFVCDPDAGCPATREAAVHVRDAPAGPVHLNLRFRAPLVPDPREAADMGARIPARTPPCPDADHGLPDLSADSRALPAVGDVRRDAAARAPWRPAGADLSGLPDLDASRLRERRTVVLACHGAGPVAAAFAVSLGLPLLAEPSSNARFSVNAVAAYPALIGSHGGRGADSHPLAGRIERVVLFGRPTLTRSVTALLARPDVETAILLTEPAPWFEVGRRAERVVGSLAELASFAGQGEPGWLAAWQTASMRAQAAVEDVVLDEDTAHGLSPQSVAQVCASVTRGPLVLGSSSLIRDVDLAWRPPTLAHVHVYANRGLAGIDGTVSTAMGIALGTGRRTVALLGDLTALHDAGGLLVGTTEADPDVDLVVVNDTGGAIFAGLEHGTVARAPGMAGAVERFFGTPHAVDLEGLAAAYGVPYVRAADRVGLVHLLAVPVRGRRLVEVRCDRTERPRVAASIAAAVRSTFPDPASEPASPEEAAR